MISIIICSKTTKISEKLSKNIDATIGVPYELIVIDNSENKYTIFSAYNEGIRRAKYDILCFMHEDILYHSNDWGKKTAAHLVDKKTGLIGLAGSYYLLATPSPWFWAKPNFKYILQGFNKENKPNKLYKSAETPQELVCLDGFWFAARKDVFENVAFDDETFDNFHFYDLDISMQIRQAGYSIYGITDILVEHFSTGSLNRQWIDAAYLFYNKWKTVLPVEVNPLFKRKPCMMLKAYRNLVFLHRKNNYPVTAETIKIGWKKLNVGIILAFFMSLFKR